MSRSSILRLLSVVLVMIGVWYFRDVVVYVVVAAVLALMARPLMKWLLRCRLGPWQMTPTAAALISLLALMGVMGMLAWIFFPVLVREAIAFSEADPAVLATILQRPLNVWQHRLEAWGVEVNLKRLIQHTLHAWITSIFNMDRLAEWAGRITSMLGGIFVGTLAIFYITFHFLRQPRLQARIVLAFTPQPWREDMLQFLHRVNEVLSAYFVGLIIQVLLVSTITYLGLAVIDIDNALIIALFTGLSNMIPFLGPLMGGIFGITLTFSANPDLLLSDQWLWMLWKLIAVFVIVQIVDNVIFQPMIFSRVARAHPLEVFLVILVAAELAGIVGMLVAVPSYMLLRIALREFVVKFRVFDDAASSHSNA